MAMKITLWYVGRVAVWGVIVAAANLAIAQGPPPPPRIEKAPAPGKDASSGIELVPGVPLGPHEPSRSGHPVGFLDSGIQPAHPQLQGLVVANRDFTGEGLQDDLGHGTKVALVFVQSQFDLEAKAKGDKNIPQTISSIAMAKVVGKKTVPTRVTVERMVAAIDWLAAQHAQVVNISMALAGNAAEFAPLCARIANSEMLFTIAAGNGGPAEVVYPAACSAENKVVVGSVTSDGQIPAYSGRSDIVAPDELTLVSQSEYYRLEGDRSAQAGEYAKARSAYDKGIEYSPTPRTVAGIRYGMGFLYLKQEKPDEALTNFLAAVDAYPQTIEAYVAGSVILTRQAKYDDALRLLERGLANGGAGNPRIHDLMARVLLGLDRPGDAVKRLDALAAVAPDFEGLPELRQAADNRVKIVNAITGGTDPQTLFWSLLEAGDDGDLVGFLARRAKVDLDAVPAGREMPALVIAAAKNLPNLVTVLLRLGAKVDAAKETTRVTALMMASSIGQADLVRTLLQAGASIDLTDDFGYTALTFAAEQGRLECVQLLLARGADPRPKSKEGKTALDYATQQGHPEISAEINRAAGCSGGACK